jgi:hypothetical protein
MRILSLLIFNVFLVFSNNQTDSPHGPDFKISCKTCHSSKGWQLDKTIYSFNHNTTKLPLVGQHARIDCKQCHTSLVFSKAGNQCSECHSDVHQATVGLDCSRCHTPDSWLVKNINELHNRSRFPLIGVHRTADCSQCHKSESLARYDVSGVRCIDCHRQNYLATTNPNHLQSGISEDCSLCHLINSFQWSGTGFNHSFFPLAKGHSAVKCTDCHKTGNYKEAKPDCYSCHQNDFIATKNPDHNAARISISCQDCHSLNPGWKPTNFDHTSFPLKLGHSTPACIDCHIGGSYASTPKDCYSCHQQNYLSTTNPNHNTSGFAKTCEFCHSLTAGWKPASVDHSRFPLKLGHSAVACGDCHIGGNYTATSTDCYSCHQKNYTATTAPNHISAGFPSTCGICHTTNPGWKPATYNHTSFPLTLGHATPVCADCHKGNYSATPKECYSCHQTDYNTTVNPNHKTLAFSTTCAQCHTTNPGWKPAIYTQHDTQFPIYSGKHNGRWATCTDCHTNTSNYSLYSCIICHEHNKTEMDSKHKGRSGYSYDSAACLRCHPRGSA